MEQLSERKIQIQFYKAMEIEFDEFSIIRFFKVAETQHSVV